MKVLLSWLREFVDVRESADEIARAMSLRGFAVEGIEPAFAEATAGRPPGDFVIDFEVTGNRPDCMSVAGMAREVATAFQLPLAGPTSMAGQPTPGPALPDTRRPGSAGEIVVSAGGPGVSITLENTDLCPYYAGGVVDVSVGPSPDWMQERLKAGGVRPISNIVDVTNYVLLELGQPMHAFDAAKLEKNEIRVRTARDGERLKTLDGQDRPLTADMLVIADGVRPVGIAGVMGGADSEVTDLTRSIVLESAYFNPLSVRRTSRKLGLKTEASTRFERGTDRRLPGPALLRACALLQQIGAGTPRANVIAGGFSDVAPRVITLRRQRVAALLGITVPDADISRILVSLGFELAAVAEGWSVTVPPRRVDVAREVDLIEEIARHNGFDRIPGRFPALLQPPAAADPRITRTRQLRSIMTGAGFFEANTFGFIARAAGAPFADERDLVAIANPLSENFGVLRPSVLPGLVGAVAYNRHREQRDIRLFEIGARFRRSGEGRTVAAVWAGATGGDHWGGGTRPVDFFDIRGVVERIVLAMGFPDCRFEPGGPAWFLPGRAATLMIKGMPFGSLGLLSPAVGEQHGLSAADAVYALELDFDLLETSASHLQTAVQPLPRFPSVARDISILVDEALPAAEVRQTISEAAPALLARIREFDRYQGKGVPEGKVSLSLRLTFRSPDRTLTDAEVQKAMDDVLRAVREKHGAVQR